MLNNNALNTILACMATSKEAYEIQKVQTAHRIKLVESWGMEEGSKILEIGCGQGDTTAVLAYYTGETGLVHGVDIGPPTYGAPITLGESTDYLKQSKLGKQIKINFNMDILSPDVDFPEDAFDYVVFSHCSWYMKSTSELLHMMKKVRKWAKQLCFAEWSTTIHSLEQYPHLLAILIQAQYEAFKQNSESNVRTILTPPEIRTVVEDAGWKVLEETTIHSQDLQDGQWEVDMVKHDINFELSRTENMPGKFKELIRSEVLMLEQYIKNGVIKPLSVYSFTAN
ncbi:class I SAM-dependent methyltransferase [Ornithinibacillus californiensis]|uniref:class I SAM-dependent methyltransferase n=1 Tax=Ornithinibacillus californiensis TaxID=161536 RepID=UPI00064D7C0B|nr:class I SAM-dependent methyltransferase [Ornithinibacillus californiensis]